jgi:hypothetical protein
MAEKLIHSKAPEIYVAVSPFYVGSQLVLAGHTVVAGHPLLKGRASLFRPFEPTWGLPVTPEPEPEPEPKHPAPVTPPKDDPETKPEPEPEATPSIDDLTKAELVALAAERGVEVDPTWTNAILRAALTVTPEPEPEPKP